MSEFFIGQIMMTGFNFAPKSWALCNGQLLPINQNQALFSLLGTQYGGNGTTNFALPDLRSRTPIGYASSVDPSWQPPSVQIGQVSGVENVTLLSTNLPSHTHSVNGDSFYATDLTGATAIAMSAESTSLAGGSQPHENCMPTLTVQHCIATEGIFPPQA